MFIFPDLSSDITNYTGVGSYGIAVLSALAREAGYETDLLHLTSEPSREVFQRKIAACRPDLIAFSANSHYARRLQEWTTWAAAGSGVPVIVGGIHATLAPQEVISLPDVTYVCVGEGEGALLDLCRTLADGTDPAGIANLWVKSVNGVTKNPPRPLIPDLDNLPNPDLEIFDYLQLYPVRRGLFPHIMSRGCAYRCTYCSAHALRNLAPRGTGFWRFLSPRRAAEQLCELIARHNPRAQEVQFLDAIFFPHVAWLREFAPLYKELVGLPFSCNLRADFVTEEVAAILLDMGCRIARFGVESGDETLTREILKRGLTLDDIRRAFAMLGRHGIDRWSYNIVGLPEEDFRTALKTIRLNAEIKPDLALAFIFYPYPGTVLYDHCAEAGYLTDREYDHYFQGAATHYPNFPEGDILFLHRFFGSLMRLYGKATMWPVPRRERWWGLLDSVLASPLLPRGTIVRFHLLYRSLRHRVGETLVSRSPGIYRFLGGTDPA